MRGRKGSSPWSEKIWTWEKTGRDEGVMPRGKGPEGLGSRVTGPLRAAERHGDGRKGDGGRESSHTRMLDRMVGVRERRGQAKH